MPCTAHHNGTDKLGLAALLEAFANDQWIGEHYSDEQACEAVIGLRKALIKEQANEVGFRYMVTARRLEGVAGL